MKAEVVLLVKINQIPSEDDREADTDDLLEIIEDELNIPARPVTTAVGYISVETDIQVVTMNVVEE